MQSIGYNSDNTRAIGATMPRVFSEETRAKMRAAKLGKKQNLTDEQRAIRSARAAAMNRARVITEETREKMREAYKRHPHPRLGKTHTPETKEKLRQATLAQMTDEFKERLRGRRATPEARAKISAANRTRVQSAETRAKRNEKLKGRTFTPEWREKIGAKHRGKKLPNHVIAALRAGWCKGARRSSIETAVASVLDSLGIVYQEQQPMGRYIVDFLIPSMGVVLEADGRYWHSRPGMAERDARKDAYLGGLGYRVVRLSEDAITSDAHGCVLRGLGG